jgi:threonine dehydratase
MTLTQANSTGLVSLEAIQEAARRIKGVARVTPCVEASTVTDRDAVQLLLKCENFQPIGAFKIRGAYNFISQLPDEVRRRGVITYSSGNHGQAVAYVARLVGTSSLIVMPTSAPPIKIDGARAYGAEVVFEGLTTLDRKTRAEREAAARGMALIPPFDDPTIVAGQGTAGLEIVDQCPSARTVYLPVGGGGLIAGVSAAIKQLNAQIRVVGVEPEGAAKMTRSLEQGRPVTLERVSSLADGLLAVRPGDLNLLHVQHYVDEVITVSERQIVEAVRWLFRFAKIVAEPSGAVSVAGALAAGRKDAGPVVALISGGNISPEAYNKILSVD